MLATRESVWALFSAKRFQIPLYQRHYDWKEEQCEALWEDFTRLCAVQESTHYLGTMVVEPSGDGVYRIVDGQQRATSLMLLLKALRDVSAAEDRDRLGALLHADTSSGSQGIGYRLTPQDTDLPSFRAVMTDLASTQMSRRTNLRFALNCELFKRLARERTLPIDQVQSALSRMHLAFIALDRKGPDQDSPQTIFEKMNAEGKNLEVHDLIRNYVFLLAAESEEDQTTTPGGARSASSKQRSLYRNEWQNFESEFPDRALGQMKHFFRDYLVIQTGDPHPESGRELYDKFKAHLRRAYPGDPFPGASQLGRFGGVDKLANEIWKYGSAWTKVAFGKEIKGAWDEQPRLQKQIREFSLIGHDPYYPLATLLLVHGQSERKLHGKLATVLEMLNKFLAVSELTGTQIEFRSKLLEPFVGSPERMKSLQMLLESPADFKAKLLALWPAGFDPAVALRQALLGGTPREPGVEQFGAESSLEPGSEAQTRDTLPAADEHGPVPAQPSREARPNGESPVVYNRATAYLLLRINDCIMRDEKDTPVDYTGPEHSLEHIMPQTVEDAVGWSGVPPEFHRSHLHSFGNLTLVGKGLNSAISNRPLSEKARYYAKSSYGLTRQLATEIGAAGLYATAATGAMDWNNFGRFLATRAQALTEHAVIALKF